MVLHRRLPPVCRSGLFPAGVSVMARGRSPTWPTECQVRHAAAQPKRCSGTFERQLSGLA
jgi:hypothetical protein